MVETFAITDDKTYQVCKLYKGDRIYTEKLTGECNLKLGSVIYEGENNSFKIVKIDYAPKKWCQFWKKKQIIGYEMEWV